MQDKNRNIYPTEYRVRDLAVASYLQTAGAELIDIEAQPGFSFFVFADTNFCSQLEQKYWSYELGNFSPRSLIENYRNLRTQAMQTGGSRG